MPRTLHFGRSLIMLEAVFSKLIFEYHIILVEQIIYRCRAISTAFGVVLVDLLIGMRAYDANPPTDQQILVELVKPHLWKRTLTRIMDLLLEG